MDDFITLSNRLLARCPAVGYELSKSMINDAWRTLQARREWSWRRRSGIFSPPDIYITGTISTNVAVGAPNILTGIGTNWTPNMVGRQIRAGGLTFPFYTIVGWQSATSLVLDMPWAGPDLVGAPYQLLQSYYPVPSDFGYFYIVTSPRDGYRLWTNMTQSDLGMIDPQRTVFGQTYTVVYKGYSSQFGGLVGPVIPVTRPGGPVPISTTSIGYTFVADSTFVVQVVAGGISGIATFQWLRAGQAAFQLPTITSDQPQDLSDGVQIYWPDGINYIAGDVYIINCSSVIAQGGQLYELWPAPTFSQFLYPYIYIAAESDLTTQKPQLPPPIAARGEVLLELALEKCASWPGPDNENPNVYYNLKQAAYHAGRAADMLIDLERNEEEVDTGNIEYQSYPYYGAPWEDGSWQQRHAPWLG